MNEPPRPFASYSDAILRSQLPPKWRNAPSELIEDYIRTIILAQSYEIYPMLSHPKFTLRKRMVYAATAPFELVDDMDSDGMNIFAQRNDEHLAGLTATERRQHDASGLQLLDQILKCHRNRSNPQ